MQKHIRSKIFINLKWAAKYPIKKSSCALALQMQKQILELRQYKNDSTEAKNPLVLKLPGFSLAYTVRGKVW